MSKASGSCLPKNWAEAQLGELVSVLDHRRIPVNKEERTKRPGPFPYYGATGQVDWIDNYIFDGEFILLGEDGAPFLDPTKIKAYIARGKFWVNNHAHVLASHKGILPAFLLHQLNQVDFHGFVSGTTRLKLPQKAMRSIPIRLAPELEQYLIVAAIEKHLSRLDAATAAIERTQANLKRYRAAILKAACEGRLVPTEAELARAEGRKYETGEQLLQKIQSEFGRGAPAVRSLANLPEGWTMAVVEQLAEVGTGATPLRSRAIYYKGGTIPWVTSGALNKPFVSSANEFVTQQALDETNLTVYPPGTLLLAMYGEGRTRGKCSELQIAACTNQAIAAITASGLAAECRRYLKIFLERNYPNIRRLSSGGVQPNLNLSLVKRTTLPLPPLAEQNRIVAEVDRLLSFIEEMEHAVETGLKRGATLRISLLKRAFQGGLVRQNPEDEPASALLARIRQLSNNFEDLRSVRHKLAAGRGHALAGDRDHRESASFSPDSTRIYIPASQGQSAVLTIVGKSRRVRSRRSGANRENAPPGLKEARGQGRLANSFQNFSHEKQIDVVWESLFGSGALESDAAVCVAAESLRDLGIARFQRLRQGGPLYQAIEASIARGLRTGDFDRPKRGHVRAVLRDPRDYTPETWSLCLLKSFDHHEAEESEALRNAAEWARENLGLEYARLRGDGIILQGLRKALRQAIRRGELVRVGKNRIRRASDA